MPAFPQCSFPPQVPVKHLVPVCRPFTLNTCTHVWKHPYQGRRRPGAPRAEWRVAWGVDSPAQMWLILPRAESSVSVSAGQHGYIAPGFLRDSPKQEAGCRAHGPCGLCTDEVWLTAHLCFVCFSFPAHSVWQILKKAWRKNQYQRFKLRETEDETSWHALIQ